ncbi:MAG: T9SS type A sorting domain-containing protein [Flavobacteriales bacterium]
MNTLDTTHTRHCFMLAAAFVAQVLCTPYATRAQNLVPNPGFEETDSCTFGLGLGALHDWYSAYLTPDHLQSCQPYGTVNSLPMNMFTYQAPYEGSSCAGIHTYLDVSGQEQREWIMVPLLDTLVPGQTYYCSFWANAAFGGNEMYPQIWLASDHLGMLFTTYDRQWTWGDPYPAALDQAHILYPQILSDTVSWTLVSGSFVADSAYIYLMIGNFFGNALTDTLHFADPGSVFPWYPFGYTLIDAVCVSPSPDGCDLEQHVSDQTGGTIYVYPNPGADALVIGNAMGSDAMVLDMLGRRVWNGRVNTDRLTVDVGPWARGAYILQVNGARGVQVVQFVLAE